MSEILRNIEIKAKLNDQARAIEKCRELARVDGELIHQVDYFFNVEKGRLKLRFMGGQSAELIFYERPNSEGPKLCKYEKCKIEDGKILLNILKNVLGIRGVVKKTRNLYLIGQTRVHIDEVVDLGNYLEFEVVLKKDQSIEEGEIIAKELMLMFEIQQNDLLSDAYIDILQRANV